MDFRDSPEEAAFRRELREWLAGNVPDDPDPLDDDERFACWQAWHRALFAAGFVGVTWPKAYGGRGLGPVYEAILNEELGAAGAPPAPHVGFLGRAILLFGSDDQKSRYLPRLLSGEDVWCQGFSEPGAGSDLASLRTAAVSDGDRYVVNGQKVWTSDAQYADLCLLLVRTDPGVPKHEGISALIVPMDTPGVTVRPLVLSSGSREFCEVFFDDVAVPRQNLVGAAGQGWAIAMTTVTFERGPADIGFTSRYRRVLGELEQDYRTGRIEASPEARRRLTRARVELEVLHLHVLRSLSQRAAGAEPGWEASVDKLLMTRVEQHLHHVAMDLRGAAPLLGLEPRVLRDYLYSRAASLAGGTSQIQRDIIARRGLHLPRP